MRLLLLLLAVGCLCAPSLARQQYLGLLPNGDSVPCPPGDPHCEVNHLCGGIGHESCAGGVVTPNLNAFGKDMLEEGVMWTKELCEKDSDGDGFSNGHELGDPCCIWKQGADIPDWMLDRPISHPGSKESTQLPDEDIEALCKDAKPLKVPEMYVEGEERITWDFPIEEYSIPARDTSYVDIRFNLPEEGTFYLVGSEALLDNEKMVYHYVVTACTNALDEDLVGKAAPISERLDANCTSTIWIWAPGVQGNQPSNVAIPIGSGVGLRGINIQMHYDNPGLIEGETDATVLRLFLTTTPRDFEGGILFTGSATSFGAIPPKKTVYSSTVYQVKVDTEIAPEGITVYGYMPHMHALGKKLWVEKLTRDSVHQDDILQAFDELNKAEDIARDDFWHIDLQAMKDVPLLTIRDGDYLATTCVFNSDNQETATIGGRSSHEEMCLAFLAFYPADAVDTQLIYDGPQFFNELSEEAYPQVHSFLDILKLPESKLELPLWRRAYLSSELECRDTKPASGPVGTGRIFGVYMGATTSNETVAACGEEFRNAFYSPEDVFEAPKCTTDCARFVHNMLGCSLLWQATSSSGEVLELYPSYLESKAESWCGKAFMEVYETDRVSAR